MIRNITLVTIFATIGMITPVHTQSIMSTITHTLPTWGQNQYTRLQTWYKTWCIKRLTQQVRNINQKLELNKIDDDAIQKLPLNEIATHISQHSSTTDETNTATHGETEVSKQAKTLQNEIKNMFKNLETALSKELDQTPKEAETQWFCQETTQTHTYYHNQEAHYNKNKHKTADNDHFPIFNWVRKRFYSELSQKYTIGIPTLDEVKNRLNNLHEWAFSHEKNIKTIVNNNTIQNIRKNINTALSQINAVNSNTVKNKYTEHERSLPLKWYLHRKFRPIDDVVLSLTGHKVSGKQLFAVLGAYAVGEIATHCCNLDNINQTIFDYTGGTLALPGAMGLAVAGITSLHK